MKKLVCIVVCTLTCLSGVYAQAVLQSVYEIKHAFDFYQHNRSMTEVLNPFNEAENIEGTPYLDDNFIKGTVFTTSKTQFVDIPLRYNVYNDQVEFMNSDDQIYAIATPEIVEKIEFGEYQMEYIPYQVANKISRGFFVVLEKGDASLYSREKISLEQAKKAAAYQDAQPARFINRPAELFIRVGMEPAKRIAKKKDLDEVFIQKNESINAFLKNNKVKMNDPKSLQELVRYYNSL